MKKILLNIIVVLILTFSDVFLFAQGGSNYSIFGFGDIQSSSSAAYRGLAETSIAFPINHSISTINPALWSKIPKTRIQTGYNFNQNLISDDKNNLLLQNNGQVNTFKTVFVIDTGMGIALSFGLMPFSTVNYLIASPIDMDYRGINTKGKIIYQGQGGISMGYLGASSKVLENLSLGAMIFSTFGTIKNSISTTFDNNSYYTSSSDIDYNFNGLGYKFGFLYEPITNFNIGGFYELHQNLDYEKNLTYVSEIQPDTSFTGSFSAFRPKAYGFGISYKTGKFRIGADYKTYNLSDLNFNKGPYTEYNNMNIYSIGVSRLGNNSVGFDFIDKIDFNFGIGYKQQYYTIKGVGLSDYFASFGMGIPLVGSTYIDVSTIFGSRGSLSNGLVREFYGKLTVDISIGETWFKPFRRKY